MAPRVKRNKKHQEAKTSSLGKKLFQSEEGILSMDATSEVHSIIDAYNKQDDELADGAARHS